MQIQAPTGFNRVLFQGKSINSQSVRFGSETSDAFEREFDRMYERRDEEPSYSDSTRRAELMQRLLDTEPDTLRNFLQGHASTLNEEGKGSWKAVMADVLLQTLFPPESK